MERIVQKMIEKIKFSVFSPEAIRKLSAAKITIPDTYNDDSYPIDGGLVDPRLGVIDPGLKCKTCGGKLRSCPGHFGHIELVRPVIHPEFSKIMLYVMRTTCPSCCRVLLEEEDIKELAAKIVQSDDVEDEMKSKTKKVSKCPHCSEKVPEIKLLKPTTFFKDKTMLLPTEVRDWLSKVSNEDLRVLGLDPLYARPEWMVITALLVPPVSVRPSITLETGDRSEDDLTHKLVDIMRINQRLDANINAGAPQLIIEDLWELLQYHVTTYFNNETANIPPARHRSGRPLKTLSQRLKGKEGRFRYNLSGKRVNFSARTVISPDPNISIDDVGVPREFAEELTIPMRATSWNLEACRQYILREEYPKAEYVTRADGKRLRVTETTRKEISDTLEPGCIIDRQLVNGDTVLFNRQPSLHRISIMCHSVKVLPGRTLRLNPSDCPPYNADYDGDEMNLHAIQTEEAQVEAEVLMKVHNQIISPRHGAPIIKPQEDHVSGAFFLTRDSTVFTKSQACTLLAIAGITRLPQPDRKDGYSGKLIFSMLLPKDLSLHIKVSHSKEKAEYSQDVIIKNGVLVDGALEKKSYENAIIQKIVSLHGTDAARKFIDDSTRIALEAVTLQGLSVSLANYTLSPEAQKQLLEIDNAVTKEIETALMQHRNRTLKRHPGKTLRETLEQMIMEITSRHREGIGVVVERQLGTHNTSIIMAKIGARGSLLNAIQMAGSVGQQAIRSKRPSRGYSRRALVHFKREDLGSAARGYVSSSFAKGLNPCEFFFHSMGGRESMVNTAIRTARSGYMQRRLINALQDLVVARDLSVRDSRGVYVQFRYGGDGVDPSKVSSLAESEEKEKED
ncbi:DNA-directed RNA polymerase subunit A' [Candidatus Micrarchaeota archaeon CG1_02_47_40]|nr:MAG: DNA-directed RNA polymerase subunit A' [Candidatus Micrarchaeota archaeon CG1_02_47_40]